MDKVKRILQFAKNGTPQALARFNDGEMGIVFNKDFIAARGHQKGSLELQTALIDAIVYERNRYWKGYPCHLCYPDLYSKCIKVGNINPDYKWNTSAVVNTNRNLKIFSEGLIEALQRKQVVWVSGNNQKLDKLNLNIVKHIKAPVKNAWSVYHDLLSRCVSVARPRRVFLFSLGPTARILVKNLFQIRPDCTYLDIGDTYFPETQGGYRRVHLGKIPKCEVCN